MKWSFHPVCQFQICSWLNSKTESSHPAAEASSASPPQNEVKLTRIHHTVTKLITGSPPLSVNAQSHHFSWLVAARSIWEASIHISTPPTHTTSLTLSLGCSILIMDSCLTVSIRMHVCVCVCVSPVKQSFPKCPASFPGGNILLWPSQQYKMSKANKTFCDQSADPFP